MTSERQPSHFSADRPIRSKSEDLLGRSAFAESLADVVEGWTGNDSLVIGLYGPWGIGKSSIKNMVMEHLREKGPEAPVVVEFNPWQWAAQDQLAAAFFREIGLALGKNDASEDAKKQSARFAAYAAYLKVGSHLASGVRPLLAFSIATAGLFGLGGAFLKASWLKPYLAVSGTAALVLAAIIKWSTDFAEKAAAAFASSQKLKERSLQETKAEVGEILKNLKKPILVVVDDFDRLTADEVRLIFQLVKANADFPNLVYLMLFQRDIVEKNLEKATSGTGKDFIEKIVQIGFDVPQVEQTKLQRVLFAGLSEALAAPEFSKNFNSVRWGNLFSVGLAPYFRTLRDVYRFLGVLDVQIAGMAPRGSLEVNPIDLIALEVLRVFEPTVYNLLPRNKEGLTRVHDQRIGKTMTDIQREDQLRLEALVAAAQPSSKPQAEETLKQLFPKVSVGNQERFYRELRVCHSDVFDRYFLLSIPEGDISQADLDDLLASTNDREQLVAKFNALRNLGLLAVVLNRLEAYKQEISLANAVPFLAALFDIGDDLPEEQTGFLQTSTWMHASRIIRWYLLNEPDVAKRHSYLAEAIKISEGLYLPVMKVALETDSQKEGRVPSERLLDDASVDDLKAMLVARVRSAAESGKLESHPKLGTLLGIWAEWTGSDEPKLWVDNFTQTARGLVVFLEAMTGKTISSGSGDSGPTESWYVQLKEVEKFIDPETVSSRLERLRPQAQNESETRALKAFDQALDRRRRGKPDGAPWRDWYPEK
jgi:predicted KAP-like P-loop ATPase